MQIHSEELSDVNRYLDKQKKLMLQSKEPEFEALIRAIRRFQPIEQDTRILEIGTGTGWFNLLCGAKGIHCKGLEISPQLVEYSRELGRNSGLEPDIELGNIETADIGESCYDVILAHAVFEHVERWRPALARIYDALKPGGVFFFSSSNKFSPRSPEYPLLFYGWLPDRWRYRLRIRKQGPDIMKLGIDFNQFTYGQLRRFFRRLGYSRVLDRVEAADAEAMASGWKRALARVCRRSRALKDLVLLFCDGTIFVCIK